MSCFDDAPEFVEQDNRQNRFFAPVSKEHLENKHEVLFPRSLVEGKSVLDLGCCLGATGHWCLSLGATKYTGVEIQKTYTDIASTLMEKYHPGNYVIEQASIEDWLNKNTQKYDVVALLGALYVFSDYYTILKQVANIAKEVIVIDALHPKLSIVEKKNYGFSKFCGVEFYDNQLINLADEDASLSGRGTRISSHGLSWIMKDFGFESIDGLLYPVPIKNTVDVYNDNPVSDRLANRYLMCFKPIAKTEISLSEDLRTNKNGLRVSWNKKDYE